MSTLVDYVYINHKLLGQNKNSRNMYLHFLGDSIYEIWIRKIFYVRLILALWIYTIWVYVNLCTHSFSYEIFKISIISTCILNST